MTARFVKKNAERKKDGEREDDGRERGRREGEGEL